MELNEPGSYYVVGSYSDSKSRTLWKVLSRCFKDALEADGWRKYEVSLPENKHRTVMLVRAIVEGEVTKEALNQSWPTVADDAEFTPVGRYFVVRTHSHTDSRLLWKVSGCDLPDYDTARRIYLSEVMAFASLGAPKYAGSPKILQMVVHPDF